MKLGRHEEALASFERAVVVRTGDVDALNNRGLALTELRRTAEALASFDRALAIDPAHVGALDNRGAALFAAGRFQDALACFDRVLALRPDDAEALYHRGHALANLGRYDEAVAAWRRVLALDPAHPNALGALAFHRLMICDWADHESFEAELKRALEQERAVVEPFTLLAYPVGAADQLRYTRQFMHRRLPATAEPLPMRETREAGKIRIAYLSADFHRHATAWLTAELFELHDRSRFEVVGISYGIDDGSEMRARLVKAFDRFHDVARRSDREVAGLLRELEVDIAIDLKGHTQDARPGILSYRPAPVQVAYLGYPATMGVDFIEYVIADAVVLPLDQQAYYTEKIVHLPASYQVNDRRQRIASGVPVRSDVGLPRDAIVFACFNNSWKITATMFDIWMRLLSAVEGSVLWLLYAHDRASDNLRAEASKRGLDPGRLVFAPKAEHADHLARHQLADIFLDTLPYNAHTTASDALGAGLPVLTCLGNTFAGRVAASLLGAVGLPELVTRSLEEYEDLALKLAMDRPLLASIRQKLQRSRSTCPLFDTERLCRDIEAAYVKMWRIRQSGGSPQSFVVSAKGD
jgi:predicted O-linked N-acetylglucosamine transferase (SPINDLY family)